MKSFKPLWQLVLAAIFKYVVHILSLKFVTQVPKVEVRVTDELFYETFVFSLAFLWGTRCSLQLITGLGHTHGSSSQVHHVFFDADLVDVHLVLLNGLLRYIR